MVRPDTAAGALGLQYSLPDWLTGLLLEWCDPDLAERIAAAADLLQGGSSEGQSGGAVAARPAIAGASLSEYDARRNAMWLRIKAKERAADSEAKPQMV